MSTAVLHGTIQSGTGQGAFFTRLDWVVDQCRTLLGWPPFPGTLNVRLGDEDLEHLDAFLRKTDAELVPEDPRFCSALVKRVAVNGVPAALVLPSEDVRVHGKRILEILAPCHLKSTLDLKDGDPVTVTGETARAAGREGTEEPMDLYRDIYDLAASAGALEGYVYPVEQRDLAYLDDWIGNLVLQVRALPDEARDRIQPALDRTVGRTILSLEPRLGSEHPHIRALRSLVKGDLPDSPHDFEQEKQEKAERYGP